MISVFTLASLSPMVILIIGIIFMIGIEERNYRKYLSLLILGLALVVNSILMSYYFITNIVQREYFFSLDKGTFLLIEFILGIGFLGLIFSRGEVEYEINENYHDAIILLILLALVGMMITSNLISIISCFILVMFLIGVKFFFGDFPKKFDLLKFYFFGVCMSIILLFIATFMTYQVFNSIDLITIKSHEIEPESNLLLSLLFFLGFGIPCGIFPFSIYHLKNYYRDSSYTGLIYFTVFTYSTLFLLLRILNLFSFNLPINGYIFSFIAAIGLIISLIFLLTELFTSLDGDSFSIKKLFGFSLIADFNMILLFISYFSILHDLNLGVEMYFNFIIVFSFLMLLTKAIFLYTLYPVLVKTQDDNIKLLGSMWNKHKKFGIFHFLSGIIISVPISIISFNSLLLVLSNDEILQNALFSFFGFSVFFIFLIYLVVLLVFISISFIQIYFSNEPLYIERELTDESKILTNQHYIPLAAIAILITCLIFISVLLPNLFYELFKSFNLILN